MLYYLAIDEKLEGGELGAPAGGGSRGKGIEGGNGKAVVKDCRD